MHFHTLDKFKRKKGYIRSHYENKLTSLNGKIKLYYDFEEDCKRRFKLDEKTKDLIKESDYV